MFTYILLLFAMGMLLTVIRIGIQIVKSWRHVDEKTLIDFWNGRLQKNDEREYRRVVTHLGNCQRCRDRLDDITQNNKTRHNIDDHLISRRF
ncbi:MAG: hypothetical protein AAFQ37_06640 [Bacteroidota bacterium]